MQNYPELQLGFPFEDISIDEAEMYPGVFFEKTENDDDPYMYDYFMEVIEPHFRQAYDFLAPLFRNRERVAIGLHLDWVGEEHTLGGYHYRKSRKGNESEMLIIYLYQLNHFHNLFKNEPGLPGADDDFFIHELLHLLDKENNTYTILQFSNIRHAWIDFILTFRTEGIAEIFHFYKQTHRELNPDKNAFYPLVMNLIQQDKPLENLFHSQYFHYTYGIWILLDCLKKVHSHNLTLLQLIEKCEQLETISYEEFIELAEKALQLDNETFFRYFNEDCSYISPEQIQECLGILQIKKVTLPKKLRKSEL